MNRRALLKASVMGAVGRIVFPGGSLLAARQSTPSARDTAFPNLLSHNVTSLPEAPAGEVAVVATSGVLGSTAGFIVHNNTDTPVGYGEVMGTARDSGGSLVGVIDSDLAAPYAIGSGQYSIGYVGFDKQLAGDVTFEIDPVFEAVGSGWIEHVDLNVSEVSITGDRIIGVVENHTQTDASTLSHIVGLFLDTDGQIVGVSRAFVDGSSVVAGRYATFTTRLDGGVTTESYLFASSGWAA